MFSRSALVLRTFLKTSFTSGACHISPQPVPDSLCPNRTRPKLRCAPVSGSRLYSKTRPMPKKDKTGKGQAAGGGAKSADTGAPGPVSRDKSGAVTITVHAKPGSKLSAITEVSAEAVGVAIAAPPADGEANTELIRFLSEVLALKRSQIALDKGSRSRDKLIRVDSSLSPEEVMQRLKKAVG